METHVFYRVLEDQGLVELDDSGWGRGSRLPPFEPHLLLLYDTWAPLFSGECWRWRETKLPRLQNPRHAIGVRS